MPQDVHPRIKREARTVCRAQHGGDGALCPDCAGLVDYARARLDRCPFQGAKTTCQKCPVHCYRPDMRDRIRAVMRYAGPRMLFRHPVLAVLHLLDGLRGNDKANHGGR